MVIVIAVVCCVQCAQEPNRRGGRARSGSGSAPERYHHDPAVRRL
jgi:hypothetical protein